MEKPDHTIDAERLCQSCGACCSYSQNWPRFSIEDDAALALIPEKFVNARQSGMRCDGDRCSALSGKVGIGVRCEIYAVRPEVCRTCMPGDAECNMARKRFGLPVVPANAGTHTPRRVLLEKEDNDQRVKQFPPVAMGPGLRRDDGGET